MNGTLDESLEKHLCGPFLSCNANPAACLPPDTALPVQNKLRILNLNLSGTSGLMNKHGITAATTVCWYQGFQNSILVQECIRFNYNQIIDYYLRLLSIEAIEQAFGSCRDDLDSAQSSVVAALPFAQTAGPQAREHERSELERAKKEQYTLDQSLSS